MPEPVPAPTVRPGRAGEIDQIGALWGEMYAYQRDHGMQLPLRDDAVEIWKRQLAERLDSPVSVVLVAEATGGAGLAGFLAAQTKRLPAHLVTGKPKVGFVSEVYVRPAERRRQLGRALVDAAFRWFDRADVGSVELHVLADNAVARSFWESVGFRTELVQMRAMRG
ncbi:MAG TPA: GNAT family N-acetyltransferase [Kofleriaceae bacterium]|nr:GNAT family N-acetyltransferase [Kofleriaceae bacterium]